MSSSYVHFTRIIEHWCLKNFDRLEWSLIGVKISNSPIDVSKKKKKLPIFVSFGKKTIVSAKLHWIFSLWYDGFWGEKLFSLGKVVCITLILLARYWDQCILGETLYFPAAHPTNTFEGGKSEKVLIHNALLSTNSMKKCLKSLNLNHLLEQKCLLIRI